MRLKTAVVSVVAGGATFCAAVGVPLAPPAAAAVSGYAQAVLADSPTAYYRLDEASGSTVHDSSGNSNDGTYVSANLGQGGALASEPDSAVTSGQRGTVLHATVPGLPANNNPVSLETWVNYVCCNAAMTVLQYGDVAGGAGFAVSLGDNADSLIVTAGASSTTVPTISGMRSGWHLLDVTYDGTRVLVYQDGQVIGGGPFGPLTTSPLGQGFIVGANATGMGVDEVAVYNSALTTARVNAHWSNGGSGLGFGTCRAAPTSPYAQAVLADSPLSYYRLDELSGANAGQVAFDSSTHCANAAYARSATAAGALASETDTGIVATARDVVLTQSGDQLPTGTASRTFEGWIDYVCCNAAYSLFHYGDVAGGNGFSVVVGDNADSLVVQGGASSVTVTIPNGYVRSGWHLVDATFDGPTGTVEIYQDGQLIGGGHLDLGATGTVVPGQGMQMTANAAGGGLDEVAVYGAALSPASVDAHWSAGESAHGVGPCAAAPTLPYPAAVVADAPSVYYRLDDATVGAQNRLVLDSSGHCVNAAYDDSPASATGALFGDNDAAIAASDRGVPFIQSGDTLPAADAARTFEGWVSYQCCNAAFDLFRYGDVAGGNGFGVRIGDNGDTISVIAGGATLTANTDTGFRSGWHLIDVTFDGSVAAIYQDGALLNSGTLGTLATALPGQGMSTGSNAQNMGLDEVAVYPVALSPKRILAHYEAKDLTPPGTSLIAGSASFVGGGAATGARMQACPTDGSACVVDATPVDSAGQFHLIVPDGTYTVTIFPPAGSSSGPYVAGPLTLPPAVTSLHAAFAVPGGLPSGASVNSPSQGTTPAGGVPTVNWGEPSTFTVTACQNGAGVLYIRATNTSTGQLETRGVALIETPAGSGTYVAQVPPLAPDHGLAGMDPQVACPGHTSMAPDGGPSAGGQHVIIGGSGFTGAKDVKFGTISAPAFTVIGDTLINATVPAGTGTSHVTVTRSSDATIDIGDYNYFDVTTISPTSGPSSGDTLVTIHGSGFDNVRGVLFGLRPARAFSVVDPNTVQATAPEGLGTVNVQVINGLAASVSTASTQFTYTGGPPGSDTIVENFGNGDNDMTGYANQVNNYCSTHDCAAAGLDGVSAAANQATAPISFGGSATGQDKPEGISALDWAGFGVAGLGVAAAIICFTPPSALACGVVGAVLAVAGFGLAVATLLDKVHLCPSIGSFNPFGCSEKVDPSGTVVDTAGNPLSGATATILTQPGGQGAFVPVDQSSGAITPATNPETTGATGAFDWDAIAGAYEVSATAPNCHAPGAPDQPTVTTPAFLIPPPKVGLVLTMECPAAAAPAPVVSAIAPSVGPASGGTVVDITGTGLATATEVDFAGKPATQLQVLSPFAIRAIAPVGSGTADVTVKTAGGTSATSAADQFTYLQPIVAAGGPTVSSLSPTTGPLTGGTVVTIDGTHLNGANAVYFGANAAATFTQISPTEIQATAPAAAFSSRVDVTVTTSVGTSPTSAADVYAYGAAPAPAASALTVAAAPNPAVHGTTVTLTATVTSTDGGGSVAFFADGAANPLSACDAQPLTPVAGAHFTATCTTSTLATADHTISAVYSGDIDNAASNNSTSVSVIDVPTNSAPPSLSGTPVVGQALTAVTGAWTSHPAVYAHQWQRCSAQGASCVSIGGATATSYNPGSADVGHTLRVLESATNIVGTGGPTASAVSGVVWTVTMLAPGSAFQTSRAITAHYAATAGNTAAAYNIRYRVAAWNGTFGAYVTPATWAGTTATTKTLTGTPGHEYCFGVQAITAAHVVSAFTPDRCTTIPLDDRSLSRSSGWTLATGTPFYAHTVTKSVKLGATLSLAKAQVKRLAVLVTMCPGCGALTAYVGTKAVATINTAATKTAYQRLIVVTLSKLTTATVVLRVATSGKPVSVDGLGISRT